MAIWECSERNGELILQYRNRDSGQVFKCGTMRAGTPVEAIVSFVIGKGSAAPFDWLRLPNGDLLQMLPALIEPEARVFPEEARDWRRRS